MKTHHSPQTFRRNLFVPGLLCALVLATAPAWAGTLHVPQAHQVTTPTIDASLGVGMVGGVKALYAVLLALVMGVGCCATAPKEGQARDANGTAKACTCKQCSGCDGSCCN